MDTIDRRHTDTSVVQCVARVGINQSNALGGVFASRLCHSRQTHRFRGCSVAASTGAFEYPKKNSRNGNKVKLYYIILLDKLTDRWLDTLDKCLVQVRLNAEVPPTQSSAQSRLKLMTSRS